MSEQELVMALIIFLVGLVCGVLVTLITNKIRSGSASPTKIKQEMEEYQDKVEAHFEQTSDKFKQMANQYQDLYKHLSVGATTLCRPENIAPGLVAGTDPLTSNLAIDKKSSNDTKNKPDTLKDAETDSKIKEDLAKLKAEKTKVKPEAKAATTNSADKKATQTSKKV